MPAKRIKGDSALAIHYIRGGTPKPNALGARWRTSITKVIGHMCSEWFQRKLGCGFTVRILA